jgi:D-alanyl-D-alanine carboxypeptidase
MKQLFLLLPLFLLAQNFDRAKMDKLFDVIEKNKQGMGSVSIFKDGKELYAKSIGYADVKLLQKANAETKYRIGSITKTYMATIIMQLVEEGKLTLDTKLSKFFPKVEDADKITIEHLLRHRSGIYNIINAGYEAWKTKKHSREDLLKRIYDAGTVFEAGEKFSYSNSGYILLTFIAEDLDKASFADILEKRITKPLNLKNSYVGGAVRAEKNEAHSYSQGSPWRIIEEADMSIPVGAGAIHANATEVNKFYSALFSEKLVKEESLDKMTELVDNGGLGLFRVPFGTLRGYGHTGGIDGYRSSTIHFPSSGLTVTYLSNAVVMVPNDIMVAVLRIYFAKDYEIPSFKAELELSEEILKSYEGLYKSAIFPLDLKIFLDGKRLLGQGTGQGAFPLTAISETTFVYKQANLEIVFDSNKKTMTLTQNGGTYSFKKE